MPPTETNSPKPNPDHQRAQPALPRRPYGPSQIPLSIIGFGGIIVQDAPQDHANRLVAQAVERGVNYFDVAPQYGDAEIKLGPALEPFRKNCFLACKTLDRRREPAQADFQRSCQRLRTTYFDLYQLHAMTDMATDVEVALAPGGVLELATELKKAGLIRHIGFSAHSVDAALALMQRYPFDSILFPVNFATYFKGDFGPQVIAQASKQGMSILALKALAQGKWEPGDPLRKNYRCWYRPITDRYLASLALRFTLSQPVTAAIPPGDERLFELALDLARDVTPLTEAEAQELQQLAQSQQPVFTR